MTDELNEIYYSVYMFNFINEKKYIGITTYNPEKRKREHLSCSRKLKPQYILHKAIKLYGEKSFEMTILEKTKNKDELKLLEKKYIKEYNTYFENGNGYNMTYGGEGNFGYKFTEEMKLKMSQKRKELIKNNPEIIKKWKESMKNFWTEDKKLSMSILKIEQIKNNPEIIEKWKESMKNYWTEDKKEKQSLLKKEQFNKNPELAKEISEIQKIRGNTLEGKIRGNPKPFNVYTLNGEHIGMFDYVPFVVNYILNEQKLLNNITEKTLGNSIRRVLSGKRNNTHGFSFKYI